MSELETYTGLMYDYSNPTREQVSFRDIFHVLSRVARFGGHTSRPYSVGEHVLLVERLVIDKGGDREQRLAALHHDSHEVYLGDWPTPLKHEFQELAPGVYRRLREKADTVILDMLGLPEDAFNDPLIREADLIALRIEAADLKVTRGLTPYWGFTDLPAEYLDYRIEQIPPQPNTIRSQLRQRHVILKPIPVPA